MRRLASVLAITALLLLPATALAGGQFTAELTPGAEVPPATVPDGYEGSGSATVTISGDETSIEYEVTYENLTGPAVAAHIHYGADGEAGGVILPLDLGASPGASGSFSGTLTEADFTAVDGGPQSFAEALEAISEGNTYVNIHTEQNPPGELRGQLTMADDGDNGATPPPTSTLRPETAGGTGSLALVLLALGGLGVFTLTVLRFQTRRR